VIDSIAREGAFVRVVLSTKSDDSTRAHGWPHDFVLRHVIRVGPSLEMSLIVQNTGREAFTFEEALHTYYAVSDVRRIGISGLAGATYLDKNQNWASIRQQQDPIAINDKCDRIYLDTTATCQIADPQSNRRIVIEKRGSNSTVVWCPWMMTPEGMPDLGEGQWQGMVCVETCNVRHNAIALAAGQSHEMSAIVRVMSDA
jgi:glucose-6-phosphate 1-epimerase